MSYYKTQQTLLQLHPELTQKPKILPYYISLQFPQKQKKLICWWSGMIESAIRCSQEVFISPSELELVFTLHGLKPVPLFAVLELVARTEGFEWRDHARERAEDEQQHTSLSFKYYLRILVNSLLPQPRNANPKLHHYTLASDTSSKILSTQYLSQQLSLIKKSILSQLNMQSTLAYDHVLQKLKREITSVSGRAIEFMLTQLGNKSWILMAEVGGRKVVMFSEELRDYGDRNWVQVQKVKFDIGVKTANMDAMVEQKIAEQMRLKDMAKNIMQKDINKAKQILQRVVNIKSIREKLQSRIKICRNKLHELQQNQANGRTVGILASAQNILKQTATDPSALDGMIEQNVEIQMQQKELNARFGELNEQNLDGEFEDQVDLMMRELERDVRGRKAAVVERRETREINTGMFN